MKTILFFATITVGLVLVAGCASPKTQSAKNIHSLVRGIYEYQEKHGDWPDSLSQIADFVGGEAELKKLLDNPLTGENPGYLYEKPVRQEMDSRVVLIYQINNGEKDLKLNVGYGDMRVSPYVAPVAP